jgi:hypothetical protein
VPRIITSAQLAASSFFTTFPLTENPLSESGKWLNGATDGIVWQDFKTLNSLACAGHTSSTSPPPYDDAIAQLKTSAIALPVNHYIQGVVKRAGGYNPAGTHELGLFVRMTITANNVTGYEIYVSTSASHTLVRWNGALNDFTALASGNISAVTVPADGDIVRLEASGSRISFYQNGLLRTQVTDTNFATGQSGLQSYMVSGGTPESYGYDSITSGAL